MKMITDKDSHMLSAFAMHLSACNVISIQAGKEIRHCTFNGPIVLNLADGSSIAFIPTRDGIHVNYGTWERIEHIVKGFTDENK